MVIKIRRMHPSDVIVTLQVQIVLHLGQAEDNCLNILFLPKTKFTVSVAKLNHLNSPPLYLNRTRGDGN